MEQQELLDTACGSVSECPTLENTFLVNLSIHISLIQLLAIQVSVAF